MSIYKVIGIMSGTSLDGVDLAYCIFDKKQGKWEFDIIKSISVEINENFNKQFQNVIDIMHNNNFVFFDKKQNDDLKNSNGPFSKSFNYIFNKK